MAQGFEVWATPDIVTWDELIERMFMLDRQAGRLDGRWLPASAAQLLWERIVRDDPELSPLLSPAGVARSAAQSWRRLHDFLVPFAALDDDQSAETAAFSRWCREYRRLLEERDWTDGALAQSRVHAQAATPGLELVGFDRLTPLQESLLQKWAGAGLEVGLAKAPRRCRQALAHAVPRSRRRDRRGGALGGRAPGREARAPGRDRGAGPGPPSR